MTLTALCNCTSPFHDQRGNTYIKAKCKQEMRRILQSAASQTHTITRVFNCLQAHFKNTVNEKPTTLITHLVVFGLVSNVSVLKNKENFCTNSWTAPSTPNSPNCHLQKDFNPCTCFRYITCIYVIR